MLAKVTQGDKLPSPTAAKKARCHEDLRLPAVYQLLEAFIQPNQLGNK